MLNVECSQAVPGKEATMPTADLPVVDGLDTKDGLARVGGNRKLYLKLLRQFVVQQADAAVQIAAQLKAGDHATAERLAHTVKGVAGNLGAKPVQLAAAELEKAIRERADSAQIETVRRQLADNFATLLGGLRSALGEKKPATTAVPATAVDPAQVKLVVAQMIKHLAEFDAAAADCLEANRNIFASLFSAEEFGKFEQQVEGYAFGEASLQLQPAAKEKGLIPE